MARASVVNKDAATLVQSHAELDRRVRELDRKAWLSQEEQAERASLKKRKLALKDQLATR